MDKTEIIQNLNKFPYNNEDYWVITGAAMGLYGIKDQTSDIDLGCNSKMADMLEQDGFSYELTEDSNRHFKFDEHIEVFENWINGSVIALENLPVITLTGLIEMKQELGREKDYKDIELIREFIKTNKA